MKAGLKVVQLSEVDLAELTTVDAAALVVFVESRAADSLVKALQKFQRNQPALPVVLLAGSRERFALWNSVQGSPFPPLVLRDSTPPAAVLDAVRAACACRWTEGMDRYVTSSGLLLGEAVKALAKALASQEPPRDECFDLFLPARLRAVSYRFWTPLDVTRRCAAWFEEVGIRSIVDIGAGVGKFCIVGALTSSCFFLGIEQRPRFARVARELARLLSVADRVTILDGQFGKVPLPQADCYYLFNPFEENLFPIQEALDGDVELSPARFRRDLRAFRSLVATSPIGTYFLSYNGIGGVLPDCLDQVRVDHGASAPLRLFRKAGRSAGAGAAGHRRGIEGR